MQSEKKSVFEVDYFDLFLSFVVVDVVDATARWTAHGCIIAQNCSNVIIYRYYIQVAIRSFINIKE